jgi:putative serine protease PepD
MSEGPWPSGAGNSPAPAPGMPDSGRPAYPAYPGDDLAARDYRLPPGRLDAAAERIETRPGPERPDTEWPEDRRGRNLAVAALAIALVSALIGGVLGGYVVTRAQGAATIPAYSLGPVPRAATNRSAGSSAGVAARVLPSVVMVRVNGGAGTGSGFVIRGGYIVTDNHVVTLDGNATNATLQIVFQDGAAVPGRLVGRDTYSDIAVIKPLGVHRLPALSLGNSAGIAVGDPVMAFGAPLGLAGTVTSGIVSAMNRPVQPGAGNGPAAPQVYLEAIQTDAPINPGNSGGPLVNSRGQVIGVNAAFDTLGGSMISGQGGSIGLGFAIPINEARRVALQLIRTGQATHAVIGALINTRFNGTGAQIASAGSSPSVVPGGPAAAVGLQAGDVIVSFDGQPISSSQTLLDAIRSQSPGARVPLVYLRQGRTYSGSLRLGSAPS